MADTPLRGASTSPSIILSGRRTLNSTNVRPSNVKGIDIIRRTTTTTTIRERIIDRAIIPYMRSKTVLFNAVGLRPGITMVGAFDGVPVTISNSVVGADGALSGNFTIPTGIPTGEKIFELTDSTSNTTAASAPYTAAGQLITKQRTITSIRNVIDTRRRRDPPVKHWKKKVVVTWVDPIAQSFLIDSEGGAYLTAIDVYFKTKDNTLPVSLYIVEMENGVPTSNILPFSNASVDAANVNASATAATATKFTFSDPVYCEAETEYAFVIRTDSDNYEAWISTLGEADITSGIGIARQPYLGSLFKSQNSTTWTPDQMSDIKFTIYQAVFNTSGSIVLRNANAANVESTMLNFHISEMNLPGAITAWKYDHDALAISTPFAPFENNDFLETNEITAGGGNLTTTGTMSTVNTNISPVIDKDRTSVFSTLTATKAASAPFIFNAGTYISQTVNLINMSDDIKVLLEVIKPNIAKNTGPDVEVYIKTSGFKATHQELKQWNGSSTVASNIGNDLAQDVLVGQRVTIYQHDSANDLITNLGECVITGFGTANEIFFKAATDITVFNGATSTLEIFVSADTTLSGVTAAQWLVGTTYAEFDIVHDTNTGKLWESTKSSNTGSQPSTVNSDWAEIPSMSMGGLDDYSIAADETQWQKLKLEDAATAGLDASAQFIEYAFIPETVLNSEFDSFSIKVELLSQNKHDIPRIKALRAIAVY